MRGQKNFEFTKGICHKIRWAENVSSCTIFDSFLAAKKGIKNGASRKFFGPSYFVTALELGIYVSTKFTELQKILNWVLPLGVIC